jgi:hypothetical protein
MIGRVSPSLGTSYVSFQLLLGGWHQLGTNNKSLRNFACLRGMR